VRRIELEFDIVPLAIQSARFYAAGKIIRSYQPEKNVSYKTALRLLCVNQLPNDFELLTGPLMLESDFYFPPPKSMRKRDLERLRNGEVIYKSTRPDLEDNLQKGTCDALTGILWHDDSQICRVISSKQYGLKPMIKITVSELKN
jgi:Holliday junction resolvase RusA-like endonuclease